MAYDKTTWIDNVTPMDAERFNKIEDALKDAYDNSEEDATVISFFQSIGWTASLTMNKIYSLLNFLGHKDLPIGTVQMYAGTVASLPNGWLACKGQEVSKTTYAKLYAIIGDMYSNGDETAGNFRLPDLQGRTAIGVGNGTATDHTNHVLASKGGRENAIVPSHNHAYVELKSHTHTYAKSGANTGSHTLTISEIPSHTHTQNSHDHKLGRRNIYATGGSAVAVVTYGGGTANDSETANTTATNKNTGGGGGHTHTISTSSTNTGSAGAATKTNTDSAGTSATGANMMPYLAVNYIIYSGVTE